MNITKTLLNELSVAMEPDAEDTYPDDAALIQVSIHYEVDSIGSRQMTVK